MPETRKFHPTQRGDPIGRPAAAPMAIVFRAIDTLKPDPSNHGSTARSRCGRSPTASGFLASTCRS